MSTFMRSVEVGEPLEPWRGDWSGGVEQTNDLLWLLQVLRLRWKLIVVVAVLLTTSVALVLRQVTPLYSATADILIDPQQAQYADLSAGPGAQQSAVWPGELETYVKVVWSDRLANDIVQSIGPASFEEPPSPLDWIREWVRPIKVTIEAWVASWRPSDDVKVSIGAESAVERAVRVFHRYLEVDRDSLAAALYVTYRAPDPVFAAHVANATAEAFPKELVRSRKAALAATADYLSERVEVLGQQLEAADTQMRALQNEMSSYDGGSVSEMRYRELIRAISEAQAQFAVAYADVARMESQQVGALSDAAVSEALADLRREERNLGRRVAEAASTLGEKHPTMLALRAEQADIRGRIRAEAARIREQSRKDLEKSEVRVTWLHQQLAEVEKQLALNMDDQVRLKQLMTRTESTRQIYQDILGRYQRASEQQLMLTPVARVINVAQPPSAPDRRKVNILLAATACGSLAAGAGLALLLELQRRGFRSSDELAHETASPVLGALPHAGRQPRPVYVEAVRRLGLHLCPVSDSEGVGIILVSSALPGEGKTVVSLSLARQLADTGKRVLLIDADLHEPGLQHLLNLAVFPTVGLTDLLTSAETKLDSAVVRDKRSEADFILGLDPVEDPGRLLASPRMAELLKTASERYDVVLIDSPPVLAVSEAMSLATLVDRMLVVVRSEATPRSAVVVALKELRAISECPLGLVLNGIRLGRSYARYAQADHLAYYRASARYLKS
jgi:succinoglycan biosynthesis transport protein ExoP